MRVPGFLSKVIYFHATCNFESDNVRYRGCVTFIPVVMVLSRRMRRQTLCPVYIVSSAPRVPFHSQRTSSSCDATSSKDPVESLFSDSGIISKPIHAGLFDLSSDVGGFESREKGCFLVE